MLYLLEYCLDLCTNYAVNKWTDIYMCDRSDKICLTMQSSYACYCVLGIFHSKKKTTLQSLFKKKYHPETSEQTEMSSEQTEMSSLII